MKRQRMLHTGVVLIAVVTIIALHGVIMYYISSHVALSAVVISSLTILLVLKFVILKRLGLPSVRVLFHRHLRH